MSVGSVDEKDQIIFAEIIGESRDRKTGSQVPLVFESAVTGQEKILSAPSPAPAEVEIPYLKVLSIVPERSFPEDIKIFEHFLVRRGEESLFHFNCFFSEFTCDADQVML